MELFKILGKIAIDGTKEAESQLENLKSKFASGAKAIGKSIAGISTVGVGIEIVNNT